MKKLISAIAVIALLLVQPLSAQQFSNKGKKIVEYGWDVQTPSYIRDNIKTIEKFPFDGVVFRLDRCSAFDTALWTKKDLQPNLDAIKQIKSKKLTSNFLIVYSATPDMDWFNDAQWKNILENAKSTAAIARAGKCVGIIFDPEAYGRDPWVYPKEFGTRPFPEVSAQLRKRGKQWVQALQRNWPDMKLLLFFFSPNQDTTLGAFCNGLIDGAKGNVKIIDGNETSYYHTDFNSYVEDWKRMTETGYNRIDPKLKRQFKKHFQAGMALYVDQSLALREPGATFVSYYMKPEDRLKYFESTVYWALKSTDEYVWCYSERLTWWDGTFPKGADDAISSAKKKLEAGEGLGFSLEPIVKNATRDREEAISKNVQKLSEDIYRIPQDVSAPVIDGKLDDPLWQKVKPLATFVPPAAITGGTAPVKTVAQVTYDDSNLYMSVSCQEIDMSQISIAGTAKDSDVWRGDTVEIFISTGSGTPYSYRHFMVNPNNAQWDGTAPPAGNDVAWNADWKSGVSKNADSWTIEVAIPWEAIGGKPTPGSLKYANICRQSTQSGWASWSSVIEGFLDAARFGQWVFKD